MEPLLMKRMVGTSGSMSSAETALPSVLSVIGVSLRTADTVGPPVFFTPLPWQAARRHATVIKRRGNLTFFIEKNYFCFLNGQR